MTRRASRNRLARLRAIDRSRSRRREHRAGRDLHLHLPKTEKNTRRKESQ